MTRERKVDWICHILHGNCHIKDIIERKREGTGRRGRRRKQLLHYFKETRRYYKLKEEALYRTVLRTGCGRGCRRGCGPVVKQTAEWL
jgi:hypothetical protein